MSSDSVEVDLGSRSYRIAVGRGLLAETGARLTAVLGARPVTVVTDRTVAAHHLAPVEESLRRAGVLAGPSLVLPPGEATKSFAQLESLLESLLGRGLERRSVLLALGGGVIGDLTGFAAAVALRGLDFVQLPTTLLAQVDSSVGGKTGINSASGKNLVGAFHQPRLVLADLDTLETLAPRQLRAGYAEVVKYGLIDDPAFFAWLEAGGGAAVLAGDTAARQRAVVTSCQAKAAIVGADERESGRRALLNLGHTFGHALEASAHYDDRLLHGEAVAIGLVLAFELSVRLGLAPADDALRLKRHLFELGLPTSPRDIAGIAWNLDELMGHMAHDKKVAEGRITFVLARGIGQSFIARDVEPEAAAAVFGEAIAVAAP